jgi:hypothetical protein
MERPGRLLVRAPPTQNLLKSLRTLGNFDRALKTQLASQPNLQVPENSLPPAVAGRNTNTIHSPVEPGDNPETFAAPQQTPAAVVGDGRKTGAFHGGRSPC